MTVEAQNREFFLVNEEDYELGGDPHGRFVASINTGHGILVVPAEIGDVSNSFYDQARQVLVMAASIQ
jgi:hypothetical protein